VKRAPEIESLLEFYDEAYDRAAWHGPNLKASLRRLTEDEAAWRPSPRRHNVWELAMHAAYWKYAVRRRLTGGRRGGFSERGSNWFARPAPGRSLREDLLLLENEHRRLRDVIAGLPVSRLSRTLPGTRHTARRMVRGVAAHDIYHAGQIRLLRSLRRTA
jgi:hypothetical protein